MTSSLPPQLNAAEVECYVFVHLPGETAPVVAGRFAHERTPDGTAVGRFTYGRSYLAREAAVAIDPYGLPLQRGEHPPVTSLGGVYGALRDAGPDAWGRAVIEYTYGGGMRIALPEITYLLAAGDDRIGALTFGRTPAPPEAPAPGHHAATALPALVEAAALVDAALGQEAVPSAEVRRAAELLLQGVTMGGARPKAVVNDAGTQWIAKFPARGDRWNMAAVEGGLLRLAQQLGLRAPAVRTVRVGGAPVLLVERFDRQPSPTGLLRARYLSGLTALNADEMPSAAWSYLGLADELRRRSVREAADRVELFDRMVFNALVSNSDDHPRNHALLCWAAEDWLLSPLYDVVPGAHAATRDRRLAMVCGRAGRLATRANLRSAAARFGLQDDEADARITVLRDRVAAEWEASLRAMGASPSDCDAIRHAIVPEAFEDPLPPG